MLRRLPCQQRGTIGNGGTAIAGIRSVTGDMFHVVVVVFSVASGLESGFSRLGWTPIPDFACGVHLASILVSPSMPANEERSPHQMSLLDCSRFKSDMLGEFRQSRCYF